MVQHVIEGVTVSPLREIRDQRGAVLHMLRADSRDFGGFGECYFSEVLPGAVKAWKLHRLQTQLIAVPMGRIRLVVYDGRAVASTQGSLLVLELGRPNSYLSVRIPPGLWYGFSCIGDTPALLANCPDLPHDPSESESRPVDFPEIPYQWAGQPNLEGN